MALVSSHCIGPSSVCTARTRAAGRTAMYRLICKNLSIRFVRPYSRHESHYSPQLTGADIKSGSIFCFECHDFIYDAKVDELYLASIVTAEEEQTRFQGSPFSMPLQVLLSLVSFPVSKNHRERFQTWVPSTQDATALENSVAIPCQGEWHISDLTFD